MHIKHILVVRLDNMGDVLMCTPAMHALRSAYPQAKITLLTSPAGAQMQPHLDMIDEVIVYRAAWVKLPPQDGVDSEVELVEQLSRAGIDVAIILTTATQNALPMALLCRMARIPIRLAYSRENPYALLTSWIPDTDVLGPHMRHEVQRQLDLVKLIGARAVTHERLHFQVRDSDRAEMQAALSAAGHAFNRPYVVIHPGASAASRRYPALAFGQVANHLTAAGWICVFCGSAEDAALVREAHAIMSQPAYNLSGQLSLGGLGALIEGAALLIANNSGPAHIAAAVSTPLVCLYALTNPQHTPWLVRARVLNRDVDCCNCLRSVCPHEHHACLRGVPPAVVADAALSLLVNEADSQLGGHDHGLLCRN